MPYKLIVAVCLLIITNNPLQSNKAHAQPVQGNASSARRQSDNDADRFSKPISRKKILQWRKTFSFMEVSWVGIENGSWISSKDKKRLLKRAEGRIIPSITTHGVEGDFKLAKLPDPGVPFALHVHTDLLHDAGGTLDDLAHLESLEWVLLEGNLDNKTLKEIAAVKSIKGLNFGINKYNKVHPDNEGVAQLAKLDNLAHLSIVGGVSDDMVKTISEFSGIETLAFPQSDIRGTTISSLKKLKKLRKLNLVQSSLQDENVAALSELKALQSLSLGSRKIGDEGLKALTPLKELRHLELSGNQITDQGIDDILLFEKLTYLNLTANEVTLAGLKRLAALKNLKTLSLWGIKLSDSEVAELKAAFPTCELDGLPE